MRNENSKFQNCWHGYDITLRVTNNGYKRLNTVGFGFKNLNMSLTEPDRGCKIMSLFPSYRMY
jgi:hypothetical protein